MGQQAVPAAVPVAYVATVVCGVVCGERRVASLTLCMCDAVQRWQCIQLPTHVPTTRISTASVSSCPAGVPASVPTRLQPAATAAVPASAKSVPTTRRRWIRAAGRVSATSFQWQILTWLRLSFRLERRGRWCEWTRTTVHV